MTRRVFAPAPLVSGATIELSEEESHYLARVRRSRVGDDVDVLDGTREAFRSILVEVAPKRCRVELRARVIVPDVPVVELGLALHDPKAALDAVARACEGGASKLVWLRTARTQFDAPTPARLERVLQAAQRQCGRPTRLAIDGPMPLSAWLTQSNTPGWIAWERAAGETADRVRPLSEMSATRLLIGPEGGFTSEEVEMARHAGLTPCSLGPWILRTEIAVTAALAWLLGAAPRVSRPDPAIT